MKKIIIKIIHTMHRSRVTSVAERDEMLRYLDEMGPEAWNKRYNPVTVAKGETRKYMEWLYELPEPYNQKAIANADLDIDKLYAVSAADALQNAFDWKESPEGLKFWEEFHSTL